MIKDIMDVAMGVTCCSGAFATILVSLIADSAGPIPDATVKMLEAARVVGIASGAIFAAFAALRLAIWLRHNRRGKKLGVMSPDESCAACRRMRQ